MKVYLTNSKIDTMSKYFAFLYEQLNKRKVAGVVLCLLGICILVLYLSSKFNSSVGDSDIFIFLIVCLGPIFFAPFYWVWHYYSAKGRYIEFYDTYLVCGDRKVDYLDVKFFYKQRKSNFSISFSHFPFSYMLVGHSDEEFSKIYELVSRIKRVPVVSRH